MSNSDIPADYDFLSGFDVICEAGDFLGRNPVRLLISFGSGDVTNPSGAPSLTPLLRDEFLAAVWAFYNTLQSHVDPNGVDWRIYSPRVILSREQIETEDPSGS